MASRRIQITFEESQPGEAVNAYEFSYFLYLFRGAYVVLLENQIDHGGERDGILHDFMRIAVELGPNGFSSKARKYLSKETDLEFVSLSKNSPLKIVAIATGASIVALSAAVILSGGEANLTSGEFKVPPLAHGIRELKRALDQAPPPKLPSERRAVKKKTLQQKRSDG